MPARAASRISASRGSVSVAASGKSLSSAKWMCGSRLPSACTSRCAISSRRSHAVEQRRHDHHRAADGGHAVELDARQPAGRNQVADDRAARSGSTARSPEPASGARPASASRASHARRRSGRRPRRAPRSRRDRPEVARRAQREERRLTRCRGPGPQSTLRSNCAAAGANQVVADVRRARLGAFARLPRALDALSATRSWPSPVGIGELLDRVAIPVAAAEVHAGVHAGGIALQHLLDQADAFEELAPVERARSGEGCRSGWPSSPARAAWCCPSARIASSTV